MQRRDGLRKGRQVGFGQHAPGRIFVEEGVAGVAVLELDEGQRARPLDVGDEGEVDAAVLERLAQHVAEEVGGQAAEIAGTGAEAADGDGDVEGRAAGRRLNTALPSAPVRGRKSIRASQQEMIIDLKPDLLSRLAGLP